MKQMKKINQDKQNYPSKMKCEGNCGEDYEADDLDIVNGKWLCRLCKYDEA